MWSGADLNSDNLQISSPAYLRISDHCRVTVRISARIWVSVRVRVGNLGLRTVVYKLLEKVTKCGSIT